MGIHVVNAEAGVCHAIASDQVVVGIGKIHPIALVLDDVIENAVVLSFPQMDAVASSGERLVFVTKHLVLLDAASADTPHVNPKSIALDSALPHLGACNSYHHTRIEGRQIAARIANHKSAHLDI